MMMAQAVVVKRRRRNECGGGVADWDPLAVDGKSISCV
jgi:hypothetical protein